MRLPRAPTSAILIATAALATACATIAPKPLPPQVTLDGVRVTRFTLLDTRLSVALTVRNPNAYDLVVRELDATLAVEDERLLTGTLLAPATLTASGDARIEIEARTDFAAIVSALDRFTRQRTVRYELTGTTVVQDGLRLPFSRRGELPAGEFLGKR
jgi:LEA14-like dessication related protein